MSIKVVLNYHNFWLKSCNFVHFRNVIIKKLKNEVNFLKIEAKG
jgi:hypothetical protein